ncbi:hypothetical protein TWF102_008097 [Orbilia oligospora]|uniref:Uncharacterized protein n=1 Tax=Orbilia oligospora TaxID=2813651 RepID=A0A7C8JFI2_ORBOL|nr:hypothetical protein TWF103_011390 [Orbilia oligospora]KAF3110520.1 hypothetical protein TWF102_008097 [Orbilia oligospora]
MGKQKAYRPTRREPNQNARCSEAQRLLAKYISDRTHSKINPSSIISSHPKRGCWRVSAENEDWPCIALKKITAKELDLMRKMLQEERVRIVINGSGLSEEQSEIGLATSSVVSIGFGSSLEDLNASAQYAIKRRH